MAHNKKRMPVISLTIFFLILLSTGLSGYYVWQGFIHGFDAYLPILASTLLLDGLGVFALVFKVSFETRRRAMVPFVASLSLLVVCSIHLAALANMRTGALSLDEADARSKRIDDERHDRNVRDANALVETNCARCSPERKRRMYQSEMSRLQKLHDATFEKIQKSSQAAERSWGRRYVEDYATAVQLIFGLLCGLAMLVNNFVRLYADDPAPRDDEFPNEIDTEKRSLVRRPRLENPAQEKATRSDTVSLFSGDTDGQQKTTRVVNREGLKRLRETLKQIAFAAGKTHFKVDPKLDGGYLWIRQFKSRAGEPETIASCRARLSLLDSAARMEPEKFRAELEAFLRERGDFEI